MMLIPPTNTEYEYEYTIRTLPPTPSCPAIRIRNTLFRTAPKLPLSSCSHLISTSLPVQIRNKECGIQKGHQRRLQEIRTHVRKYGAQNTKRKHVTPRLWHVSSKIYTVTGPTREGLVRSRACNTDASNGYRVRSIQDVLVALLLLQGRADRRAFLDTQVALAIRRVWPAHPSQWGRSCQTQRAPRRGAAPCASPVAT